MATFKEFKNLKEFKTWLNSQKVTRKITRLQVHHMDDPSYKIWKNTDCRIWGEKNAPLNRTQSLNDYGKSTWGSGAYDGHGHYIAQHFNIFPNGVITTGRNLNSKPIGIKNWNDGAICVEIYGCFDKGRDIMTSAQKEAVIGLYALLCERFNITPSTSSIRYHCWFTASGTYLGDYNPNRSAKTCPGTAFFGGNSMAKMKANFLPLIKNFDTKNLKTETTTSNDSNKEEIKYIKNISGKNINLRDKADWDAPAVNKMHPDDVFTYVKTVDAKNGQTKMYLTKSGLYVTASSKYTKLYTK